MEFQFILTLDLSAERTILADEISIDHSYLLARIVNVWTQKDSKVQGLQNEPFWQMRLCDGVSQVHHVLLDFIQVIHFVTMQTTMR